MTETTSRNGAAGGGGRSRSDGSKPLKLLFRELGQSNRVGRRFDGRTQDPYEPKLSGLSAFRTYEEMLTDATIGGVMLAVEQIIRNVSWWVEPAGAEKKYMDAATFLEESRTDMSDTWPEFVIEAFSFLPHGWSFFETIYKYRRGFNEDPMYHSKFDDGLISWRKHSIRAQDSIMKWEFQDDGDGIESMVQTVDPNPKTGEPGGLRAIPLYPKGLLFRTKPHRRSPEGRSILRNAYRAWYRKQRVEEIEGIGIERELAGLPVLTAPEDLDLFDDEDEDMIAIRHEATDLIKSVRANEAEGLLLPFGWEFQLASTGGTRAIDVGKVIARHDQAAAMSMLADFILLGHQAVGSFSLADVKTNLFAYGLSAWLDVFTEVMNNYGIPRLFRLNQKFPQDKLPQLKHGDTEAPDLGELSGFITSLTGAGVLIPGPEIEEYCRSVGGLPPIPEERKQIHSDINDLQLEQKLNPPIAPGEEDPEKPSEDPKKRGEQAKPTEDPTQPVQGRNGQPATGRQQSAQVRNGSIGAAQGAGQQRNGSSRAGRT